MALRLCSLDLATLDRLPVAGYAVFVAEDERPLFGLAGLLDWRLVGGLSRLCEAGSLVGSGGEALLTPTAGALPGARVLAFGIGKLAAVTLDAFSAHARAAAAAVVRAGLASVVIGLPEQPRPAAAARLLVDAFSAEAKLETWLAGDLQELALALPDVAAKSR